MRVVLLGTGTLLPDDDHRSPAFWVEAGACRVLLDCGSGAVHGTARHALEWQKVTHVALSHYHTDHTGDLPALFWALTHGPDPSRTKPLTVLGPPGLEALWAGLEDAFGPHMTDPGFPVLLHELQRSDRFEVAGGPLRFRTRPTPHTDHSVAYRLETPGATLGYTGDTGPAPDLGEFFAGVDLLIAECAQPDPPVHDNHLSPGGVAALAAKARPGLLVATHVYPPLQREEVPDLIRAAGYTGPSGAGVDGLSIEIDEGAVRLRRPGASGGSVRGGGDDPPARPGRR